MANLVLWRHAEAEMESASGRDTDRALTKRGETDAAKMACWLNKHLPADTEILCSPARRCVQTADALHRLNQAKVHIVDFLSVDSSVARIAHEVMNTDSSKTILIVGHQPNLGLLIAKVLGMDNVAVKKGAVWWLRQRVRTLGLGDVLQTYLFSVQHPAHV